MTVTAEPAARQSAGVAAGLDPGVCRGVPVVGERQQDGLLGGGPAAGGVRLGNEDLGGLVGGADHREGAALDLAHR